MADFFAADVANERGLGLRQGSDRRKRERRQRNRATPDRRRRDRRRARFRTFVLAAVTLATPFSLKTTKPQPRIFVWSSDFRAAPPEKAYEHLIQEAANAYAMDAALIRAVMRAESSFNPLVVSRAGAAGLMQLMPSLAKEMGVRNPFDPRENIMAGARYLRQMLDLHRGNIQLALASYNAGPTAVRRYRNRIPPFKETRSYVKKIIRFLTEEKQGRSD